MGKKRKNCKSFMNFNHFLYCALLLSFPAVMLCSLPNRSKSVDAITQASSRAICSESQRSSSTKLVRIPSFNLFDSAKSTPESVESAPNSDATMPVPRWWHPKVTQIGIDITNAATIENEKRLNVLGNEMKQQGNAYLRRYNEHTGRISMINQTLNLHEQRLDRQRYDINKSEASILNLKIDHAALLKSVQAHLKRGNANVDIYNALFSDQEKLINGQAQQIIALQNQKKSDDSTQEQNAQTMSQLATKVNALEKTIDNQQLQITQLQQEVDTSVQRWQVGALGAAGALMAWLTK